MLLVHICFLVPKALWKIFDDCWRSALQRLLKVPAGNVAGLKTAEMFDVNFVLEIKRFRVARKFFFN